MNNNERSSFFSQKAHPIDRNVTNTSFLTIFPFGVTKTFFYPHESDNTMLFVMLVLVLFPLFVGAIGIPLTQEEINSDILSKLLTPSINLLHQNSTHLVDWYEVLKNPILSVSITYFGILLAYFFYKPFYSSLNNWNILIFFYKRGPKRILCDKILNSLYDWSYNRAYIDAFYTRSLTEGIRGLAELTHLFDRRVIDGITNGVGITGFFVGEGVKYLGGSRISFYLLLYLFSVLIFFLIFFF